MPNQGVSLSVLDVLLNELAAFKCTTPALVLEEASAVAAASPPLRVSLADIEMGNYTFCSYYDKEPHKFLIKGTLVEDVIIEAHKYIRMYIDPLAIHPVVMRYPKNYKPDARRLAALPVPPVL